MKKQDLVKRTLTGKQVKYTKEQFSDAACKVAAVRDLYEAKPENLGGYTKIFPTQTTQHYEKYLKESERLWIKLTGVSEKVVQQEKKLPLPPRPGPVHRRSASRDAAHAGESPSRNTPDVFTRLTQRPNYLKPLTSERSISR